MSLPAPGTGDVPALVARARAARERGARADALALWEEAAVLQPRHVGLRLEAASDLRELGRPGEAAAAYQAALSIAPGHPGALIGLGHCARLGGNRQAALDWFRAAVDADPAHVWARLEWAGLLREFGRTAEAEAAYRHVLDAVPGQAAALLGLGLCARGRGDVAASLGFHQAVVSADPGHLWGRLQLAADLRDMGRLDEAEAAYRHVLVVRPAHVAALLGLGQCARSRGDRAAALGWHARAAAAGPENAWCRLEHAADLRELGRLDEARAVLTAALETTPFDAMASIAMASVEAAAGHAELAREYLTGAMAADPANVAVRLELAALLGEEGGAEQARTQIGAVLATDPHNVPALVALGRMERSCGRHGQALAAFEQACALQPRRADLLVHAAVEERQLGRQAACDRLLEKAAALEPGNAAVVQHLAEQARMARDMPRAHAIVTDAVARQPARIDLQFGYAESLALMGSGREALDRLDALEARLGGSTAITVRRIGLLRRMGHWHRALALARQAAVEPSAGFACWIERLSCETLLGTDAEIDECTLRVPARTVRERAALARVLARVHEDRNDLGAASSWCARAATLEPDHADTQLVAARLAFKALDLEAVQAALQRYIDARAPALRLSRQPARVSQAHFYGQILDDYRLDSATLPALRRAAALPAVLRTAATRRIVAACPDSVAAAVALVGALRGSGLRPTALAGAAANDHIPPTIVQFWDTADVPADADEIMRSWQAVHPGYRVCRFDDLSAHRFIAETYGLPAARVYGRTQNPAQKSDLFRLGYLAAHGGIYADSDDRCHAPLEAIVPPTARLVLYEEDFGTIGNNFIAAAPGHPVIARAFRLAMTAVARGDEDVVWLSTGPALLTRAFAQQLAEPAASPAWLQTTALLGRRDMARVTAMHCLMGYKATPSYWANAFGANALGANAPESPGSTPQNRKI